MSEPFFAGPILVWLLVLWLLGPATFPLSRRLWRNVLPDAGHAAGRILALCLISLFAFWLGHAGISVRFSSIFILLFLPLGLIVSWREREILSQVWQKKRRAILLSEAIFLATFFFFLSLRGFWPDTFDGEKPMDMALFSACARAESLPPPNPYAAGLRLDSYYYFGHLQAALLTNAIFSSPQVGYNLMCATLPALVFSSLFSLCAALCKSLKLGFYAASGVLCLGTLEPLRQIWPQLFGAPLDERAYFATSRVIPFTINEYPLFTFAFGDLHAHFFAMPIAVLILCVAFALWSTPEQSRAAWSTPGALLGVAVLGLALAALMMTNVWNFPLSLLLGFWAVWRAGVSLRVKIIHTTLLFFIALLASAPWWLRLQSSASKIHFQLPLSPVVAWLLVWGIFCVALIFGWIYRSRENEGATETKFCFALATGGILALAICEFFWTGFLEAPFHRQDTVFKFGLQAWYFLGVAAWCLALTQIHTRRWPGILRLMFVPFLVVMLYSSAIVVWERAQEFKNFRGFDAWAQLSPNQRAAAQWLQAHARDGENLMEAEAYQGGDYSEYSRYTHATGIPIVIGPQAHTWQWIGNWDEVFKRKRDVRKFYQGASRNRLVILNFYRVRWIVCGELERREYGADFIRQIENSLPVAARFGEAGDADSVVICQNPTPL